MQSICIFDCMKMFLTAVIKVEHASNDLLQSSQVKSSMFYLGINKYMFLALT